MNPQKQPTLTDFDTRFGVLTKLTDPNLLVTTRAYDGFGRLGLEKRPDSTTTTVTLARTKDGGPQQNAWRVVQRSTVSGGADDTVEYGSLGRSIRWWWHGPDTGTAPRVMQEIGYDALGEHVARRSVPVSEGTPESALLDDTYLYDALGREVQHTTPWNAVTRTLYGGLNVSRIDPLFAITITALDPLGRVVGVSDATQALTSYTYGPFGALYTVTAPGGALTRTTRDAFGRVRQLDDPDKGTTTSVHDGFGELMSSTDASERTVSFTYDGLGRTLSRLDQDAGQSLTTTWTWDTAAHGVGKLAQLVSPDGTKSYTYTGLTQLNTITLAVNGESDTLQATLGYDTLGRVGTITYPTPAGAAPFSVIQSYDAYGHMLTVSDGTTNKPYWHLTGVDNAGRYRSEVFGNGAATTRSYFPDKQSLQSIVTTSGATTVQNLAYDYDARRDLASRTDTLQAQNTTERFRYDPVERLTCAYFSVTESASAPCALSYGYDPSGNGNLTAKSDVGTLAYGDPAHPHAVTGAGSDSFGYDAVGNQTSRPGGATVSYTPFDLPSTMTGATGAVTFAYDGDEQRIRKSTPNEETVYFGDSLRASDRRCPCDDRPPLLRPLAGAGGRDGHPGGAKPGTVYVHVDHLGSVDTLTDASGNAAGKQSYDPFGAPRSATWGDTTPPPPPATTLGYTGQESDVELALVNFKGRIYDPKVGRFLTTDPIVSEPLSGQSWNPYSYVVNNPLNYVDPSGFEEAPMVPGQPTLYVCIGPKCNDSPPPPPPPVEGSREAVQVGAATRPVDVSTTGSAPGHVAQPVYITWQPWPAGADAGPAIAAFNDAAARSIADLPRQYALATVAYVMPVQVFVFAVALGLFSPDSAFAPTFNTVPIDRPSTLDRAIEIGVPVALGAAGTALGGRGGPPAETAPTAEGANGLTRGQAAMLDRLRLGEDVIVRNVAEGRMLLENSGLKPYTSQRYLPAAPAPRGTYRGDLLNTADPTAPYVHPPGTAPPQHALGPHFNLYFFNGEKAAIIIRTE